MSFDQIYEFIDELNNIEQLKQIHALCDYRLCDKMGIYSSTIECPEDFVRQFGWMKFEEKENFVVATLDSSNNIIGKHRISMGLVNQVPVHPREAFKEAIKDNAVSVMFAHNHPSGNSEPSEQDIAITRVLCRAGKILQIPVLDHIIITRKKFTSLCRMNPDIFENTMNQERT